MSQLISIFCPNCGDPLQVSVVVDYIGHDGPDTRLDTTNPALRVKFRAAMVEHSCPSRVKDAPTA